MTDPRPVDPIVALEQRLGRLRILCWLSIVIAAGALGWSLRPDPGISEGRLWLARDEAGRVRGMFGVTNEAVALTMYDSTGRLRLDVGLAPNGAPGLLLRSKVGDPVATVTVSDSGIPIIRLTNGSAERIELAPRPGALLVETGSSNPPDTVLRGGRQ